MPARARRCTIAHVVNASSYLIELSCCHDPARLCSTCTAGKLAQLKGTARCRGEVWAMDVAARVPRDQPWPITKRMVMLARLKVADLARDERLLRLLTRELVTYAARAWSAAS